MSDDMPPLAAASFRVAKTCATCNYVQSIDQRLFCVRMDSSVMEYHVCDLYENYHCLECGGSRWSETAEGEAVPCQTCKGTGIAEDEV